MKVEINQKNYKKYKKEDSFTIDNSFIIKHKIKPGGLIYINEIHDKTCLLVIENIDVKKLEIRIRACHLKSLYINSIRIEKCILYNLNLGDASMVEDASPIGFYPLTVDNTSIVTFWVYYSQFNHGLLIRKSSQIKSVQIKDTKIPTDVTYIDSFSDTFEVESSSVHFISVYNSSTQTSDHLQASEINKLNIFRTEIHKGLSLYEANIKKIHLHKVRLRKTEHLNDFKNQIFISIPNEANINDINITESYLEAPFICKIDILSSFAVKNSLVNNFKLIFQKLNSFEAYETRFLGNIDWGYRNVVKQITHYLLTNCNFEGSFEFASVNVLATVKITGCKFHKYPSFFLGISFPNNGTYDFSFTNFSNVSFKEINFENVNLITADIADAIFEDCIWQELNYRFYSRSKIADENGKTHSLTELVKIKSIYSKLNKAFSSKSDYINSRKFFISEQEVKRRIAKITKSRWEYFTLSAHKWVSSYGENFIQPLLYIAIIWLVFAIVYPFTGFFANESLIDYKLCFEPRNFISTTIDFFKSLIFSIKNLLPFPISASFFLYAGKTQPLTQTLELTQKFINLALFTSFTTALIRFIKK